MLDDSHVVVLSAQDHPERRNLPEGEYRLLVAVLEQAIRSYLVGRNARTGQRRLDHDEVRRWFHGSEQLGPNGRFTFRLLCELLEIDAQVLRERLNSIGVHALPTHRQPRLHPLAAGPRRARRQRTATADLTRARDRDGRATVTSLQGGAPSWER